MNPTLAKMARSLIKEGLQQCSNGQQDFFKRIYTDGNFELNIDTVVDRMPDDKLDWALTQIENTIKQNEGRDADFYSSLQMALDFTGLCAKVSS